MPIQTINDLKPDPNNANRGTERGHRIVNNSIQRHGAGRSGLAARDGTMIAGSQTLEEMAALGMKIKPVHTTGDEWVVVIRDDVEPGSEQATLMGLEDNRGAQEGIEWDPGILAELAQQFDVSGLFTGDELAEWAQPSEPEAGAGGDEFDTTPDDGPTRAQLGDLWIIGGVHRLLVGDCTDPANVARLMDGERAALCFTSPPYNVAAESSLPNKNKYRADRQKYSDDQHDNRSEDEYLQFLLTFTTLALENSEYVFVNVQSVAGNKIALIYYLYGLKKQYADTLIWDKLTAEPAMAHNVLNSRFEYIHVFSHKANRAIGTRDFRGTIENVYSLNSRQDKDFSDIHRATFPLEFPLYFTEQFTNANEIVLDMFLGTGTTLIAAHRTGRRCYGCELAPKYADVILRRAEAEGLTVERVGN